MEQGNHGFNQSISFDTIDNITPNSPNQYELLTLGTPVHAPVAPMNDAIENLHNTMHDYFSKISQRIDALEMFISQIHTLIADRNGFGTEVTSSVTLPNSQQQSLTGPFSPQPQQQQQQQQQQQLLHAPSPAPSSSIASPAGPAVRYEYELVLEGVKSSFFTERHFPPFIVRLIDVNTGQVHTAANDWCVLFHLYDGYGRLVDEKLADDKTRKQYLMDGQTEVNGLRFMQVSSKNGGFFQLEAELIQPSEYAPLVQRGRSENITVMSCRLFTSRKGSISRLNAAESVSKLPGIGRQYAQRLHDQGIRTIGDLASLSLDERDRERRQQLLDMVRREKGTMTEAKLVEYIRTAKSIVNGNGVAAFTGKRDYDDYASHEVYEEDVNAFKKQRIFDNPLEMPAFAIAGENMDSYLNANFVEDTQNTFMNQNAYSGTALSAPSWEYRSITSNNDCDQTTGSKITLQSSSSSTASKSQSRVQSPLMVAVASRSLSACESTINTLRSKGLAIETPNQPFNALMLASMIGAGDIVNYLLTINEITHNATSVGGLNALHFAVLQRHPECVKSIIGSNKIDLNAATSQGFTPLMLACMLGDVHIVSLLVNADSKPHITSPLPNGLCAFHFAVQSGSVQIVESLHHITSITSFKEILTIPSLMHFAAMSGSVSMVEWLCSHHITASNTFQGWTPLHIAAARAFADIVRVLCEVSGIDVNTQTPEGWTALSLCSMHDQSHDDETTPSDISQCINTLISKGSIDNGSHIPASAVSLVCSNLDAIMALHTNHALPDVMNLPSGTITMIDLTKAIGNNDVVDMLVSRPVQ